MNWMDELAIETWDKAWKATMKAMRHELRKKKIIGIFNSGS